MFVGQASLWLERSLKSLVELTRGRSSYRQKHYAEVEEKMCSVTNTNGQRSEQHKELGRSRCQRDYKYLSY